MPIDAAPGSCTADIVIETEGYRLSTDFITSKNSLDEILAILIEEIEAVAPLGCKRVDTCQMA